MDVKDLIYTEDNVLPLSALSSFIKWLNTQDHNFKTSQLAGNVVDNSIRKVQDFNLLKNTKSQTEIHWLNFLLHNFIKSIGNYQKKFKVNTGIVKALEVTVLKYTNSSHYKYHIDHGGTTPRTLSLIYLCRLLTLIIILRFLQPLLVLFYICHITFVLRCRLILLINFLV